jgi:HEAT repeat protein
MSWGVVTWVRHHGGAKPSPLVYNERTPLPALIGGLREGDARALLIVFPRVNARTGPGAKAATEGEAEELIATLDATKAGFLRFGSYGRSSAMVLVTQALMRLGVDGAPACWTQALRSVHDLFALGLADNDLQTRVTALNEVARFWTWFPGRSMMRVEEDKLFEWKGALYAPVLRHLADREPASRAAAVACLGSLPDDPAAIPALASLEDRSEGAGVVRKQVLSSFAQRPALLTEDLLLKRLRDPEPGIPEMAELILSTRGLTREQIDLGRLIFDPKPEHRASVIARIRNRTDIDPAVWLIQLSRDEDETVRLGAVEALAERQTPEVLQRLSEMARSDRSPAVRQVAGKLAPTDSDPASKAATANAQPIPLPKPRHPGAALNLPANPEATAALPALPGSPSLNPKAN